MRDNVIDETQRPFTRAQDAAMVINDLFYAFVKACNVEFLREVI
jgi:hypothetical protein